MKKPQSTCYKSTTGSELVSMAAIAIALVATPAAAQDNAVDEPTDATSAGVPQDEEAIVITGFRASLNTALNQKREETAAIDAIIAEDIGKFPDSNLAESMQRIPGVSLSRGDGGEGRNISVRGLGAGFTRVRINGMEGTSQTGSSDIYGAGNSGRSFDFNVFPSEIFSALTVRKTSSADVEEGSLGATVDLKAPRPLDYADDFVLSATARGVYNEVSKKLDPRGSLLISKTFGDGTFGVLGSLAYTKRNIREVGYSAVDILSASRGGNQLGSGLGAMPFCSPIGVVPISPSPITHAGKGATPTMCSTNNPRTGTVDAWNTIMAQVDPDDPLGRPAGGAFFPRIPRFVNSEQDNERYAGTLTFQWAPTDDTDVWVDGLFSRYDVTRRDNYIAGLSFARNVNNNGQPMVSVKEIEFDENGSLVYGLFDGVDVRSEGLVDHFISTFKQGNFNFRHRFSDAFEINGMAGISRSIWDGPERLQTFIDVIDSDNFSIDYRDGKSTPIIGFGFDVSDPSAFTYAPGLADGTVLGGFSTQGKPSKLTIDNKTFELNTITNIAENFAVHIGGQWREGDYKAFNARQYSGQNVTKPLPAGVTLADITTQITGLDDLFGRGAPSSWVAVDADAWRETFDFPGAFDFCFEAACGAGTARVRERVKSGYVMVKFDTQDMLPIPIRGDAGVRYVHTDQRSIGYLIQSLASSPTGVTGVENRVDRSYEDWLPSANIVFEFMPTLLGRLSLAEVMSRPEYGPLIPSSAAITATTRNGSTNNPFLDPIRASTIDVALEWYFRPGSMLSAAYFYKNIRSFIQNDSVQIPFNQLGLPNSLLDGTNSVPTDIFTIRQPLNTPGGPLKGYEINAQVALDFLPGVLGNFGVLANYTHVKSKITYVTPDGNYVADLVGLSKNAASGTLYYEDDRFSIRGTASYRGRYIRGIIGANGNDYQGNQPNTFVDASASYKVTDQIKLILEAQNLTDERNTLFVDGTREDTLFETRIGRTFMFGVNFQM